MTPVLGWFAPTPVSVVPPEPPSDGDAWSSLEHALPRTVRRMLVAEQTRCMEDLR
jgi:hypothetical protein